MDIKAELLTRLQQIISEHLGVEEHEVTKNSTWKELGADSLDRLAMSLAMEEAFKVSLPHEVGERLNTVGETLDHLSMVMAMPRDVAGIRIEAVTTDQQWSEASRIRIQVFSEEHGFSFTPLPQPGERGVWHFLAFDNSDPIGTLSVVDTTHDRQLHERCRVPSEVRDRVARHAQLAIMKPYRNRGILKMLLANAQNKVIRPNGFNVEWLLYPAARVGPSVLMRELGFAAEGPVLKTEFGKCHVLIRRGSCLAQSSWTEKTIPVVEHTPALSLRRGV